MRISHMSVTNTLGPGLRYAIWVQGCDKRCPGCINPEGQHLDGGFETSIDAMLYNIKKSPDITGVTISGGEPFLQYDALKELVYEVKKQTALDIMLYSGYRLEELKKMYPDSSDFFGYIDIFIDGEYVESQNDNSSWRGSYNQNIYCFTDKYKTYAKQMKKNKTRKFSFEITEEGEIFFVGIPPKGMYEEFMTKIGGKNYEWKKSV